ncbi:MAG: beta-N-acetylhexosaminidase [Sphaerochaetaceae bacterium]|nr:beta-N-acetylhexosaminidase [Sphaerochaetaceae bacterium]
MNIRPLTTIKASEQLIPAPAQIIDTNGIFSFNSDIGIIYSDSLSDEATLAAREYARILGYDRPLPVHPLDESSKDDRGTRYRQDSITLVLDATSDCAAEAYSIEATPRSVVIEAKDSDGVWWGLQTIRQLLLTTGGDVPCFTCVDQPRFSWRGFMLDCSRHFFTVAFIKKMIDAASLHHLNRFHWHLVDDQGWRIPVPEYPQLTAVGAYRTKLKQTWDTTYGDYYTAEQIKDVVAYATRRHVMVVPEIETPGHASALLAAYPELGCTGGPYQVEARWGIFDDVMCVGNDKVLAVLDAVFKTVAELFPSPYIHIGGDECPRARWKECPKCRRRMLEEGLRSADELQSWMTVQVAKLVNKYGRRAIGWDEVLDGTETLGLPKDVIVMSWRGMEGGAKASSLGHQVIMCPSTAGCYLDHKHLDSPEEPGYISVATVRASYETDPVADGMDVNQAKMVIGGQGNLWTEKVCSSKQAEYMYFPRLSALAEGLWTPKERRDFDSFRRRIPALQTRLEALGFYFYKGALSEEERARGGGY